MWRYRQKATLKTMKKNKKLSNRLLDIKVSALKHPPELKKYSKTKRFRPAIDQSLKISN